jgi:hypothetical protein
MHAAAYWGHIDQVPDQLLDRATMLVSDDLGNTPMHVAARRGNLSRLPGWMREEPFLLAKNNAGETPLAKALAPDADAAKRPLPKNMLPLQYYVAEIRSGVDNPAHALPEVSEYARYCGSPEAKEFLRVRRETAPTLRGDATTARRLRPLPVPHGVEFATEPGR